MRQKYLGHKTLVAAGMSCCLGFVTASLGAEQWDRVLWTRQCLTLFGARPGAPWAVGEFWASSSEGVGCDGLLGLARPCGTPGWDTRLITCPAGSG